MQGKTCKFSFECVQTAEVLDLLKCLPTTGCPGIDNLDNLVINKTAEYIAAPMTHTINQSIKNGIFPFQWKEGKIIPLIKDRKLCFNGSNCRPICILPALSKIMEKIIHSQISKYFHTNNLMTSSQHAYRKAHSTSTALIQMTDAWLKRMDNSELVGVVMLDFSAAFDVINHHILTEKLKSYGFTTSAVLLMQSYLTDRKQKVFYNGCLSESKSLQCGLPQGSCLGPLLFSVFINDFPFAINKASVTIYADDSTVYYAAESCNEINVVLSKELDLIHKWAKCNHLVLNVSKTKALLIGSKQKLAHSAELKLKLAGKSLQQVDKARLLGLVIDSNLSWSEHINTIVNKMGRAIATTKKCCHYVKRDTLEIITKSLILCHLTYCSEVWSSASRKDLTKLQIAQNKAARLVLGCSIKTSREHMYSSLTWLSLNQRIHVTLGILLHNTLSIRLPEFLFNQITLRSSIHNYSTRIAVTGHVSTSYPNASFMKRTVLYRASSIWNEIPISIREVSNKALFKLRLKYHALKSISMFK